MRKVETGREAMMFVGQMARVNKVEFMVAGFSTRDGVTFIFKHRNGMEMRMDSESCLSCATINGNAMGVEE